MLLGTGREGQWEGMCVDTSAQSREQGGGIWGQVSRGRPSTDSRLQEGSGLQLRPTRLKEPGSPRARREQAPSAPSPVGWLVLPWNPQRGRETWLPTWGGLTPTQPCRRGGQQVPALSFVVPTTEDLLWPLLRGEVQGGRIPALSPPPADTV